MEAFEVMWLKNGGGIHGKESCKKYWRGCLIWIQEHVKKGHDVANIIEKELEEHITDGEEKTNQRKML